MKPILIISFTGRHNSEALAQRATKALIDSPMKLGKIEVIGASIYETHMSVINHNIAHAFLYGFWARESEDE